MIPSALSSQLEQGIADFLRVSFWSSTPGMEGVIDRLIGTTGGILKGPYVSVRLPFALGRDREFFPEVPLGYPAYRHQERAFARLSGDAARSTLVATGTGSGKTESFLLPILEHCLRNAGRRGIKAILVYPMNALATDQAQRLAARIHGNERLRGAIRAGLYIGESPGEKREAHATMGPTHLITSRRRLQLDPPDILLTNYKMLDYLLIRPGDQALWKHNSPDCLRYLVVDELHTFDGAQGTDLACLIRRLKSRLEVPSGQLVCVGTSATLGERKADTKTDGKADAKADTKADGKAVDVLRHYAGEIFGEPFDANAVITETRESPEDFFAETLIEFAGPVSARHLEALDPASYATPLQYLTAQQKLWFDETIDAEPGSDSWRVELGGQLKRHGMLRNFLTLLADGPATVDELVDGLARSSRALRAAPLLARRAVTSFLALIAMARDWREEWEDARLQREGLGKSRPTRPFLEVRLQLWQRELARMVADVAPAPTLSFSDDLNEAQRRRHLPLVHCRDCGAMGWATMVTKDKPHVYRTGLERFYRAFFSNSADVRFLWPAASAPETSQDSTWRKAARFELHLESLTRVTDPEGIDAAERLPVVVSSNLRRVGEAVELHRDCPFCEARDSLTLVGFRAATLLSVYIDQLFASTYNDDKKLLTFSDSVQDAAHRAGFFGARTWRFNLRVALQQTVQGAAEGTSLATLRAAFVERWRGGPGGPGGMVPVQYAATFLAPNMEWFHDFEAMKESGELAADAPLLHDIDRRVGFEIGAEYGHQSRIGRSLSRTGCSTVYLDPERLRAATDTLLLPLQNELAGMQTLSRERLDAFLVGALHHLRERGGIDYAELPREFISSGGKDTHVFSRHKCLPRFGKTSRLPAFLTDHAQSPRFDVLIHKSAPGSWYEQWVRRCFGSLSPLIATPLELWSLALPILVQQGLLTETEARGSRVWGVAADALRVTARVARLACQRCGHWMVVAEVERAYWAQMPCLTARCDGAYLPRGGDPVDYFGRLFSQGEVVRVMAEEHTGLLTRKVREQIEDAFKATGPARRPWFTNLLSCTPTLEMGIDIGDLSSGILCSVPPAQANYLQRVGRAGRRDGNAFVLTLAAAKPHDLYFYAEPKEMLSGDVAPPGVFLNASAVLERQLAAFCLDQWNAAGTPPDALPRKLREVFEHLEDQGNSRFPHNWLDFVQVRQEQLLERFLQLFEGHLSPDAHTHLRAFLLGNRKSDEGSLGWKVLDALGGEKKQRDSLKSDKNKVQKAIEVLEKSAVQDKPQALELAALRQELRALATLVKEIESRQTLEYLTDLGLLPNYAFPESSIRLQSVIWRRKQSKANGERAFDTRAYEYARPAMAAISELAPENRFYAGGRQVRIDRVDMKTSSTELWRLCDQCSHSARIDTGEDVKDCPACGSHGWGEDVQKRTLLRLRQVFANTSDEKSRIRDDHDERQPRFYNRNMLLTFRDEDRQGAWRIDADAMPFGFEYIRRARFQEVNFGEHSEEGPKYSIAGRSEVRQGFRVCKECGQVQPRPKKEKQEKLEVRDPDAPDDLEVRHTLWCSARKKEAAASFEVALYLYREFSSEALRLLLPLTDLGTEKQLSSFVAAFQLGLRDRYGGRVDHLQTMVYSEPEPDTGFRRQYLVLYDTVPGGTGYLKDFTRLPEGAEEEGHPLLDVLERALRRLTRCACFSDPNRDGCYRCLYAYRNSRDMAETSSATAVELFGRILQQRSLLKPIESLSDISVSGLMDSVLEARFIEALRRFDRADRPVRVEKAIIRNKPGYRVTVDGHAWNIEQQLELGPAQGVTPVVSIDFVFHPAQSGSRLPIAVFLDGFQYHRDRVGRDMLQRMTLLSSGLYDVWSFTWTDVDVAFHAEVEKAPFQLHPDANALKALFGKLQLGKWWDRLEDHVLPVFVDSLGTASDAVPWDRLASAGVLSQISQPGTVNRAHWLAEIRALMPNEAMPWFESAGNDWMYVRRPSHGALPFVGLWAAVPKEAARDLAKVAEYRVLAWLDDRETHHDSVDFRRAWNGFLHLLQYLRRLPNAWFVTSHEHHTLDFASLGALRAVGGNLGAVGPATEIMVEGVAVGSSSPVQVSMMGWPLEDIDPDFKPLVATLAQKGVPIPSIGLDLPDARGFSSGVEGELGWEALRVAVVKTAAPDGSRPVAQDWTLFMLDALLENPEPLVHALQGTLQHTAKMGGV